MAKKQNKTQEPKVESLTVRICESQSTWVVRDSIEITVADYPELEGMSDEEIVAYINENAYDFELKDGSEGNIVDEIMFGGDIIKDKQNDEEVEFYLD
mgnify:CR=1 FL=1